MNEIAQLELLSESIGNEINELMELLGASDKMLLKAKKASFQKQLENIISNLQSNNNAVYRTFEELNSLGGELERMKREQNIMIDVLNEKLTYEEKMDMRLRYRIELD